MILTTSQSQDDVERCYGLGANCYIRKPFEYSEIRDMVKGILGFWFSWVRLPLG